MSKYLLPPRDSVKPRSPKKLSPAAPEAQPPVILHQTPDGDIEVLVHEAFRLPDGGVDCEALWLRLGGSGSSTDIEIWGHCQ